MPQTRDDPGTRTPGIGERPIAGRYRIERLLKAANGVETLFGTDLVLDQQVVIKTALGSALPLGMQLRLEHEASVLEQVRGPWIAPLLHFGREGDRLYLVMPYLAGITLAERIVRGRLSVRDTVTLGCCLMRALHEVHDQGVLHRDVKPANLIVDEAEPLQKATLIDFGLARSARLDASVRDQPVGTAQYISPEQAGLLAQDSDERSDLYSAGAVLFECLAGRPPFEAANLGELLRQHMTAHPRELRSLGLTIPRALDEIIQRLLRKDPRDRYQSAAAVLADLGKLAAALDRGKSDPMLVVGTCDRRRTLTEPAFVGRQRELTALDAQVEEARQGRGGLVLLEAESGGGKTRLLTELAQRSTRVGAWVLQGQGLDQQAQRPFQVLVGVAAEIIAASRREPTLKHILHQCLGEQRDAACAVLPELTEVVGSAATKVLGPEAFGQVRGLQALVGFLDALGTADHPAIVVLDDCQWADELTIKLLEQWHKRRDAEQRRHVLVVVAFRSEEVDADHLLRKLKAACHLKLPPFSAEDVRRLTESMAGPLPEEALTVLGQLSEGSPYMAAAVLQGFVESGALVAEPTGWRVEPLAMADVQSSRHAAAFLSRRIEMLPTDVQDLLSAGAVLGKEFDLVLAMALTGQSQSLPLGGGAIAALDEARRRHLIWVKEHGTRCAFVHDKLRQTLLERLTPSAREQLHGSAALHLERQDPGRIFELAYHFDAAGQSARAFPYAVAAAERARAQHSLEIAEQQYRIAARGVPDDDKSARLRLAQGLGEVLMLRGRYDQAAQLFEAALFLAQDMTPAPAGRGQSRDLEDIIQAEIEGKIGELTFKRGNVRRAGDHVEKALRLLGRKAPRWNATFYLLVLWEVLVQTLHTWCPRLFLGRRPLQGAEKELLAMRLYSRLAHLYWFHRGTVPALWAHLRGLNLAERYPPTPELAQAYSEHAPGMSLIGRFRRGIAYAEKSLAIRKQLEDLWGQGQSLHFYGVVLYASGHFRECLKKCRAAVRLLERTGDYWEVNIARFQIAASLYRLGDLAGAVAEARHMHQSGLELGDAQASGISLDIWSRASLGRAPHETIQAELQRATGDVQRLAQVSIAEGVRLFHADQPDHAAEVLEHARLLTQRAGIKNAWVAPLFPWLASALRRQMEKASDVTPYRRVQLCRRARAAARQALRLARRFPNELPHALRENALLSARLGRPRQARRFFQESLTVAECQGAIHEHAQSLRARGQVGLELDWPGAREDVAEAEAILHTLEAPIVDKEAPRTSATQPATLSLADRFDTVLEAGRGIATALSRDAIFAAVREAALKLLRGERCLVLNVEGENGHEDITTASGELQGSYSRTMVRRALSAGRAVSTLEGVSGQASESMLLTGLRSSLCAPILARGRVAGCFYVSHHEVAGLFGAEEERLADFIATIAGAALENAQGFAELRRLNQTLEQQISEGKLAAERIKQQAALLDKAQDAIVVVDLDDRIVYWNQSSERLYGWQAAETLGKGAGEFLFKDPLLLAEAHRALREQGEWTGELRQVTRAGREMSVESRWTLVHDDAGRPRARLIVNTDITEKKKLEAQFLRAQRMESLGTLAGGIAHDINNVLTPVLMAAEILRRDLPAQDRQTLLDGLQTSAQRGAEMVKQILSFARGVEGQRMPLQLKHVVIDLEKMLQHTLPKSIDLRTKIAKDLWMISGDATQLYQMLMNLCVNARDAMPRGGKLNITAANIVLMEHDLKMHPRAKAGPHVLIKVEDTGTGIPPEILDKIFDPFFTTKEFGKGTGLGLSTVLGIAKGHGGFINVSSATGAGTQFLIYLPSAESPAPATGDSKADALTAGNGELILVVDDEEAIRTIARINLQAHGYNVLTARDGEEALSIYIQRRHEVQLVITDMAMPGLDGQRTIQGLRMINPEALIIAASGLTTTLEAAKAAGAHACVPKPYSMHQLLTAMKEVLSLRSGR